MRYIGEFWAKKASRTKTEMRTFLYKSNSNIKQYNSNIEED